MTREEVHHHTLAALGRALRAHTAREGEERRKGTFLRCLGCTFVAAAAAAARSPRNKRAALGVELRDTAGPRVREHRSGWGRL